MVITRTRKTVVKRPTLKRGWILNGAKLSALAITISLLLSGCGPQQARDVADNASAGPADQGTPIANQRGNASRGKDVFRDETFGNEGFWTDAMRLPQGIAAAKVTPNQALALGLNVDLARVPLHTTLGVALQLLADHTGKSSSILNDPKVTIELLNANAVIGFHAVDSNHDGKIDITKGDKVGATCALCHTRIGFDVLRVPQGGAIGFRKDGRATHGLDFGSLIALAENPKAYWPSLQLALKAYGGRTFGRAPTGLTLQSSEEEVRAYLRNKDYYPVGMFDDSPDGIGDPMHNSALFRQDIAAPFGTPGNVGRLDNFSNFVYTIAFDPTVLTTPAGRAYLTKFNGEAAGNEIADDYVKILADSGVTGYPFVKSSPPSDPAQSGTEDYPAGVRVDEGKLRDLNAYLDSLPAPNGAHGDARMASRGRELFTTTGGCTSCHNVDQNRPVPAFIVPMKTIFPGDNPEVIAQRQPPLNPILITPGSNFDAKDAVNNASVRGLQRGEAMPLLLDLAAKPNFLHDNSVPSLDALLDPSRGPQAPHPFYIADPQERAAMVTFLKSLDTRSR